MKQIVGDWQEFYRDEFSLATDLSAIRVPRGRNGFDRTLYIVSGITMLQAYERCSQVLPCYSSKQWLQGVFEPSIRCPYAIRVRNRVEPDKEHRNKSAADLMEADIPGISVLERLIFGLKFFRETGKLLDTGFTTTACTGSLSFNGRIFGMDHCDGWLKFRTGKVDYRNPDWCCREVHVVS